MISSEQDQEIWAVLLSEGAPVPNVELDLTLTLPDGSEQNYRMPATDEDGESRQTIPPIEAENGMLIPYQVCVTIENGQSICVVDSYLIWSIATPQITPTLPPKHIKLPAAAV